MLVDAADAGDQRQAVGNAAVAVAPRAVEAATAIRLAWTSSHSPKETVAVCVLKERRVKTKRLEPTCLPHPAARLQPPQLQPLWMA